MLCKIKFSNNSAGSNLKNGKYFVPTNIELDGKKNSCSRKNLGEGTEGKKKTEYTKHNTK